MPSTPGRPRLVTSLLTFRNDLKQADWRQPLTQAELMVILNVVLTIGGECLAQSGTPDAVVTVLRNQVSCLTPSMARAGLAL